MIRILTFAVMMALPAAALIAQTAPPTQTASPAQTAAPAAVAPSGASLTGAPCWIQDVTSTAGKVWVLCDRNQLFVSADSGQTWKNAKVPVDVKLRAIRFFDDSRGFIAGDQGTILASSDGGMAWTKVKVDATQHLTSIFLSGQLVWVGGYSGTILHSNDGGRTFTRQATGVAQALDSVFFTDPLHGCAVGWGGTIVRTVDGGKTWKPIKTGNSQWSLSAVFFRDANNGWTVGMFGQILRTKDGGVNWEPLVSPVRATLASVAFDATGRGWITAENDVLTSTDGEKWVAANRAELTFYHRVVRVGDTVWAVSPFGIIRPSADGKTWQKLDSLKAS